MVCVPIMITMEKSLLFYAHAGKINKLKQSNVLSVDRSVILCKIDVNNIVSN